MKRGRTSIVQVVLYGLSALIWIAIFLRTLRSGQPWVMQFFALAVWTIGFFILLRRYLRERAYTDDFAYNYEGED